MHATTIHRSRNGTPKKTSLRRGIPTLLNGDHLTVPEFERRYEAVQEDQRAELIEGIVVMSPPISSDHGKANSLLDWLLRHYAAATPGVVCAVNASVRLDGSNEYQPDVMLWIESGNMAKAKVGANGLLEGCPEMVVEIALSSSSYDMHEKMEVYSRNQIPEYFVWEVMDARLHWFALKEGQYVPLEGGQGGIVRSRIFPGLWLDLHALSCGDDKKALRALDRGLKSATHKAFVKQLAKS
jgi:Uma2 family endonuclease